MKSLESYRRTFEQVKKRHRWSSGNAVLRFAALCLAGVPGANPVEAMERAAETLKRKSGFWASLNSPLRTLLAAMILRRGLDPSRIHDAMEKTCAELKKRGLGGYGEYKRLAGLILAFRHGPETPGIVFDRLQEIHATWVRDHWWLTGEDDLPMAALHASRSESVDALTARLEETYRRLVEAGCGRGNALQLASHILGVRPWDGRRAAGRFADIAAAFESEHRSIGRGQYDEVALLALTTGPAERIARKVAGACEVLRADVGWTGQGLAFPLAVGCWLAEQAPAPDVTEAHEIVSAKQVMDIVAAQAAAAVVCIS